MEISKRRRVPLVWVAVVTALAVLLLASSVSAQPAGKDADAGGAKKADKPPVAPGGGDKDVVETSPGDFKELHIRNVEIRGALEMLNSQVKKNIVTTKEVTGTVTADMYGVTFAEALDGILRANGLAHTVKGRFIYVMTVEQKAKATKVERKQTVEMFRLSYVNAADIRVLITPLLSESGTVAITPAAAQGITVSSTEAGGNTYATSDVVIVRDFDDNIRRVADTIKELDVRPDQVLIEATLLRARLGEDNALGVDFNVLSGIDFSALGMTTTALQSLTSPAAPAAVIANKDMATFRTDFNASIPAGGLTFGFVENKVGVFVRALEGITDVTVMANPKLLVINKQRGEVMVGNKDGYLTTTFTETTASQTVEFLETGTKLVVRPFIGRDDYVRLEIHPEDSSGAVSQVGTAALPSETTTEVTSNVLIRDGHTIVIGGLFREETSANRAQTPLIGNIPYLGALWRSTADSTDREEVIILVTPRIIRQVAAEAVSEQLRDDVERFRVGARKGMRWWGRSRLAQAQIRYARNAMTKGNRDKALWHIDAALSMRPDLLEAVGLKERLTSRAYWADAAQTSSARFIIQQMMMTELGKPVERVIPHRRPLDGQGLDDKVKDAFGITPKIQDPLELAPPPVVEGDPAAAAAPADADIPAATVADPAAVADPAEDGQGQEAETEVGMGEADPVGDLAADEASGDGP